MTDNEILHDYILSIGGTEGVLRELTYWCKTGSLLGEFAPGGITISDAIAWQVDHFKAYMDREENNRWHRERLFLQSLETLLDINDGDTQVLGKIRGESGESGTDREDV